MDDLLEQLQQLPTRTYSYILLVALVGPVVSKLLGFGVFANWVRPLALLVLLGGMYAKQQRAASEAGRSRSAAF